MYYYCTIALFIIIIINVRLRCLLLLYNCINIHYYCTTVLFIIGIVRLHYLLIWRPPTMTYLFFTEKQETLDHQLIHIAKISKRPYVLC
jgi:hypothetical protein